MRYFGTPFPADDPAPVYLGIERTAVPVGSDCGYCGSPIIISDRGFLLPYVDARLETGEIAYHRNCFMSSILGPDWRSQR